MFLTRKKTMLAASVLCALLAAGFGFHQAQAEPKPVPPQERPDFDNGPGAINPEQRAQFDAIIADHQQKIKPLLDKIRAKHIQLKTLGSSPSPNPDAIGRVAEELVALQNEMENADKALEERVKQELGWETAGRAPRYGRPAGPGFGKPNPDQPGFDGPRDPRGNYGPESFGVPCGPCRNFGPRGFNAPCPPADFTPDGFGCPGAFPPAEGRIEQRGPRAFHGYHGYRGGCDRGAPQFPQQPEQPSRPEKQ